jgi:hypothetical protein
MMKTFKSLSAEQKLAFLKLPVYISLLAASGKKLDEAEKLSAIKLAHTRSFSCEPLLAEFYMEADKEFESMIILTDKELPKELQLRETAIKRELLKLDKIIMEFGEEYTLAMHRSLKTFKEHVSNAHHSVIEDFVLPLSIPGLNG